MIVSLPEEFIVPIIYKDSFKFARAEETKSLEASSAEALKLKEEEVEASTKQSTNSSIYKDLDELCYKAIIRP